MPFSITKNTDYSFLENVYLQKSPYLINGKNLEKMREEQPSNPIEFNLAVKDFESGQVYYVLYKKDEANFIALNQSEGEFLVEVVTQDIYYGEESSTITYFNDITFGVLNEQIKSQQQLETEISAVL